MSNDLAGIDVRLPERAASLCGARLIYVERLPVAAVTYRVGGGFAALLVTKRRGTGGEKREVGHARPIVRVAGDMRLASWNMGGEAFTIALADAAPQRECLLCHTE